VLHRLRRIEADFNKKYIATRYHKLPDADRYTMVVAFEGETSCGSRQAHVLIRIAQGKKKRVSREMLVGLFPNEFRFRWHRYSPNPALFEEKRAAYPWESPTVHDPLLWIARANVARSIYAVKWARKQDVIWSRIEFVTPRKTNKFANENLRVITHRNRQKRLALGLR
jgi:hypothetical protein